MVRRKKKAKAKAKAKAAQTTAQCGRGMGLRLPEDLHAELERIARTEDRSVSGIVRTILKHAMHCPHRKRWAPRAYR